MVTGWIPTTDKIQEKMTIEKLLQAIRAGGQGWLYQNPWEKISGIGAGIQEPISFAATTLAAPFMKMPTGERAISTWTPQKAMAGGEIRQQYEKLPWQAKVPLELGIGLVTGGIGGAGKILPEVKWAAMTLVERGSLLKSLGLASHLAQASWSALASEGKQILSEALPNIKVAQSAIKAVMKGIPEVAPKIANAAEQAAILASQKAAQLIKVKDELSKVIFERLKGQPYVKDVNTVRNTLEKMPADKIEQLVRTHLGEPATLPLPVIDKMKGALDYALGVQKETAQLYKGQRGKTAGVLSEIYQEGQGLESYKKALGALKGQLEKAPFELPEQFKTTPEEMNSILNSLYEKVGGVYTKTRGGYAKIKTVGGYTIHDAATPITKLFGVVPEQLQKHEIELLNNLFPELRSITSAYETFGQKAWKNFVDAANLPKSVLASGDFSVTFRQLALGLARKPQYLPGVIKAQLKVIFNPENYDNLMSTLLARPDVQKFIDNGLYWAPATGKQVANLSIREEQFMSNMVYRIPILKQWVSVSDRAFTGGANYFRAMMAKDYAEMLTKMGQYTDENVEALAKLTNAMTGRGAFEGAFKGLQKAAPALNAMMFSPRYVFSRFQFLTAMGSSNPIVRKEAIRTFVQGMGIGASVLTMAHLSGARVGMNPLSSDFGKIIIGNTRFDIWTGYSQWIRFLAQFAMAERKTIAGKKQELNRLDTLWRMAQSKASPLASLLTDLTAGKTYLGEPMFKGGWETVRREAKSRLTPLFIQDLLEALEENGAIGGVLAVPALFGVGIQSYEGVPKGLGSKLRNLK